MADADLHFRNPDPGIAVTVERKVPGVDPGYEIKGETRCDKCRKWCWLSEGPFRFLMAAKGIPLCVQCTAETVTEDRYIGKV